MTAAFDAARDELVRHIDSIDHDIAEARAELERQEWEREAVRRELAAMDRARELLSAPEGGAVGEQRQQEPEPVRQRRDIEGPVMALFKRPDAAFSEAAISAFTYLPADARR